MDTDYHLGKDIISKFSIKGQVAAVVPFGAGHINGTYRVVNAESSAPDYLLQHINSYVFKDVEGLTENIKLVTDFLRTQLHDEIAAGKAEVLTLIPCVDGKYYYKDGKGRYWRLFYFLKDSKSYDLVATDQQSFEGGRAFGKFQRLVSRLDASLLIETIPDFLNMRYRLRQFDEALAVDPLKRAQDCAGEIGFINARRDRMCTILKMADAGDLPLRITHNDTKFNNVLLNQNDEAYCVIDLDTVMPGYVAYDFGDAIRTIINAAPEDEADLSKIQLSIPFFEAFAKGYLSETSNFLTPPELESLMYGVLLLPYMQAVRFLADHIDGDNYYKTAFSGHNLQRTRAQIQLVAKIEEHEALLREIIAKAAASYQSIQA